MNGDGRLPERELLKGEVPFTFVMLKLVAATIPSWSIQAPKTIDLENNRFRMVSQLQHTIEFVGAERYLLKYSQDANFFWYGSR